MASLWYFLSIALEIQAKHTHLRPPGEDFANTD
jgi:hypothetical protein